MQCAPPFPCGTHGVFRPHASYVKATARTISTIACCLSLCRSLAGQTSVHRVKCSAQAFTFLDFANIANITAHADSVDWGGNACRGTVHTSPDGHSNTEVRLRDQCRQGCQTQVLTSGHYHAAVTRPSSHAPQLLCACTPCTVHPRRNATALHSPKQVFLQLELPRSVCCTMLNFLFPLFSFSHVC